MPKPKIKRSLFYLAWGVIAEIRGRPGGGDSGVGTGALPLLIFGGVLLGFFGFYFGLQFL